MTSGALVASAAGLAAALGSAGLASGSAELAKPLYRESAAAAGVPSKGKSALDISAGCLPASI
jgi:hypothetical protein